MNVIPFRPNLSISLYFVKINFIHVEEQQIRARGLIKTYFRSRKSRRTGVSSEFVYHRAS